MAEKSRDRAQHATKSAERWELGADGEVEVGGQLARLTSEWTLVHDIAWPGRQRANVDHVAIGPPGVFVIDAKNWSGRVELRDSQLRQNGRGRDSTVASAAEAALAVQGLLPPGVKCSAVLCFVRGEQLRGTAGEVIVCSTATVLEMLMTRPTVLDPHQVKIAAAAVRQSAHAPGKFRVGKPTSRRRLAGVTSRPPTSRTRRGRAPSLGRSAALLVGGVLLIAGLNSGALTQASHWFATQFVATVQPDEDVQPPAEKPANSQQTRQERRERRQAGR